MPVDHHHHHHRRTSSLSDEMRQVAKAYARSKDTELDNAGLFDHLVDEGIVSREELKKQDPVGVSGKRCSIAQRKTRWLQQSLRALNLLERDPERRGVWRLTGEGKRQFVRPEPKRVLLGFSTDLGVALWGAAEDVFANIEDPLVLVLTSPPYPLAKMRAYGNVSEKAYVDFICKLIEPAVKNLVRGGSIILNISNDVLLPNSPARSTYVERLTLALCERLNLHLMDRLIWQNNSKAPGPVLYASIARTQLNVGWEPLLWMTNDPLAVKSDNRRVLMEHTERHLKLIRGGGEIRERKFSDGAYSLRKGKSFANETAGRIPRNVLNFGHACPGQKAYKQAARELGLPVHGAPFPESLVRFLVKFLTEPGDLVADLCAGSQTVAAVCEELERPWLTSEIMGEFVRGGAERLRHAAGFQLHEDLLEGLRLKHQHPTMDGQSAFAFE